MKNRFLQLSAILAFVATFQVGHAQTPKDFYDVGTIQDIQIKFEQENWRYILDSLRFNGDNMLLGDVTVNGKRYEDVGIRYRATRSFQPGSLRNGLDIVLNFVDQNTNHQGYTTLALSSALRDPSMVREVLGFEIARNYMPAPKANYARVSINGKLYGLFVNIETVDASFVQRHLNETGGMMYRCTVKSDSKAIPGCRSNIFGSLQVDNSAECYRQNYELVYGTGYDPLMNLAGTLRDRPQDIANVLHVDRTLWMLAFNNVMLNLNSYTGQHSTNYFLFRSQSGQFTPILWDLNLAFGSYKNTGIGSDLKANAVVQLDPLLHAEYSERPLISQLLSNELYKKMYLSHMVSLTKDFLTNDRYETRAKQLQALIRSDLSKDAGWPYTLSEFDQSLKSTIGKKSKIPGIVEVMSPRGDYLKKHPELIVIPPRISDIKVQRRERLSAVMLTTFKIQARVDEFPKRVRIFYRFNENGPFNEAGMADDGKSEDESANDGIYGINIAPVGGARSIEYYIFAENARMVSYDPPRYMFEFHKASLDEINQ
ncbi:MAG: CotH kinase family protein [Saprospiraceae bacterium]|nr:CotH kinase family protein [Saprospiraceae bacterium]